MNSLSQQKAFHTALIISPPIAQWPSLQNIRKFNDPAYERWMPHINMSFPFVIETDIDVAFDLLQEELKEFEAFPLVFKTLGFFNHSKKCVLLAEPNVENEELKRLEEKITKILPFCNDLVQKNDGFHPHLTLGHFDEKTIEKKKEEFEKQWIPISFMVNELYVIFRKDAVSPFFVTKTIRLKSNDHVTHWENINKEMKTFERDFYQTNCF